MHGQKHPSQRCFAKHVPVLCLPLICRRFSLGTGVTDHFGQADWLAIAIPGILQAIAIPVLVMNGCKAYLRASAGSDSWARAVKGQARQLDPHTQLKLATCMGYLTW